MIINDKISVLINHRNKRYFSKYNPNIGETIYVESVDLPHGSRAFIKYECDVCKGVFSTNCDTYYRTLKRKSSVEELQGLSLCKKCCQKKAEQTNINNFGVSSYSKTNYYKKIIFEKYGFENISQLESVKKIKRELAYKKYGVYNVLQSIEIKDRIKLTCLEKYGVDNPTKNREIFEKAQASSYRKIKYKDTDIIYQGSYELDFIKYCINNTITFEKGLTIDYILDNKNRKYHSDFYIPKYNLICEIKSLYTYNVDYNENIAKQEYTIKSGYNFLFLVDKNYTELQKIINNYEKNK